MIRVIFGGEKQKGGKRGQKRTDREDRRQSKSVWYSIFHDVRKKKRNMSYKGGQMKRKRKKGSEEWRTSLSKKESGVYGHDVCL